MQTNTQTTNKAIVKTECREPNLRFQDLASRRVESNFEGGYLSSEGGSLFLREIEGKHRIIQRLAQCFEDRRRAELIEHSVQELLSQRILGLALGYEDLNDHDRLRHDPLLATVCGKADPLGKNRREQQDCGKALAGKSTLNRLELASERADARYKKIVANADQIQELLLELGVQALPRDRKAIVLDLDATDDPLHGAQEGRFFHGYYKSYCYLPLYCFCGNIPLWAQLRTSGRDASDGTVEALEKIVGAVRKRFGKRKRVMVRADSGFARETIMAWCEGQKNVFYCLGLARNARLQAKLEAPFKEIESAIEEKRVEAPQRRFSEFDYQTRESWSRARRVIAKAEVTEQGRNPRFVVTNLEGKKFAPAKLYERIYCARGDMENQIKAQQMDLFADRTSTRSMDSNQLRLWFSAFAHLMIERLRADALAHTSLALATIGTIRLRLLKLAARVKVSARRILVEWCSACPNQEDYRRAYAALSG